MYSHSANRARQAVCMADRVQLLVEPLSVVCVVGVGRVMACRCTPAPVVRSCADGWRTTGPLTLRP